MTRALLVAVLVMQPALMARPAGVHAQANARPERQIRIGASLGSLAYPLGNDGCGNGQSAVGVRAAATQRITRSIDVEAGASAISALDLTICQADLVPRGPGTYVDRQFEQDLFDATLITPELRATMHGNGRATWELGVGGGYALSPHSAPFALASAGIRLGRRRALIVNAEYRSYWIEHEWVRTVIDADNSWHQMSLGFRRRPRHAVSFGVTLALPLR